MIASEYDEAKGTCPKIPVWALQQICTVHLETTNKLSNPRRACAARVRVLGLSVVVWGWGWGTWSLPKVSGQQKWKQIQNVSSAEEELGKPTWQATRLPSPTSLKPHPTLKPSTLLPSYTILPHPTCRTRSYPCSTLSYPILPFRPQRTSSNLHEPHHHRASKVCRVLLH